MNKRLSVRFVVAAILVLSAFESMAQTFYPLKAPECLTSPSSLFTTGGQYNDPNNGVIPNSYSMLMRWQGPIASVDYDVGTFTGLEPPAPRAQYQAGTQPQDPNGSPATQLSCADAGMLLNTWSVPHVQIVGGGYNDMYGYSWGKASGPTPFRYVDGEPADLVVQASLAVPWISRHLGASTDSTRQMPTFDLSLFAYIQDTTNLSLPPIAIIGIVGSDVRQKVDGTRDSLFVNNKYVTEGSVGADYSGGVYFGSSPIITSTRYLNVVFLDSAAQEYEQAPSYIGYVTYPASNAPLRFYRMHVSRKNLTQLIYAINNRNVYPQYVGCEEGCPNAAAYSSNPDNYIVTYAGVINEVRLFDKQFNNNSVDPNSDPTVRNNNDQISAGVRLSNVGIYQAVPASSYKTGVASLADYYYEQITGQAASAVDRDSLIGPALNESSSDASVNDFRNIATTLLQRMGYTFPYPTPAGCTSNNIDNAGYVAGLYCALLGRNPTASESTQWVNQLNSGVSRASVLSSILSLPEYYTFTSNSLYVDSQVVPLQPASAPSESLQNVALASAGGYASASSQYNSSYPVSAINNGERAGVNWSNGGGWADGTLDQFPDWVQIRFNGTANINRVVVYTVQDNWQNPVEPSDTMTFTQYGIVDFDVQIWDGAQWSTVASVNGNNLVKRTVTFNAATTSAIRINVRNAFGDLSRITEVEAWGTRVSTDTNVAISSAGSVASASSQYSPGFPISAINNGDRAGQNWTNGGGWADGTNNAFPDWAEIDFNGTKTLSSVIVYTLQDNWQSPSEPNDTMTFSQWGITDFAVQAWDGTQWVTVGTVSGNNLVKRTVPVFVTTNKIRIYVTNALQGLSRITEVEAYGH